MRFLKKTLFLVTVLMMIPLSYGAEVAEGPVAVLPSPSFEFATVADGTEVTHEFSVRNAGSAVLDILEIKTG
jgi:hypothetical protein